jgi:hypothetical protein
LLGVRFGLGQLDVRFDVADKSSQLRVSRKLVLSPFSLFQNELGFFLISPEIGIGDALFGCFQTCAVLFGVKDNSGRG